MNAIYLKLVERTKKTPSATEEKANAYANACVLFTRTIALYHIVSTAKSDGLPAMHLGWEYPDIVHEPLFRMPILHLSKGTEDHLAH